MSECAWRAAEGCGCTAQAVRACVSSNVVIRCVCITETDARVCCGDLRAWHAWRTRRRTRHESRIHDRYDRASRASCGRGTPNTRGYQLRGNLPYRQAPRRSLFTSCFVALHEALTALAFSPYRLQVTVTRVFWCYRINPYIEYT